MGRRPARTDIWPHTTRLLPWLVATFIGLEQQSATVNVTPGAAATHDFNLTVAQENKTIVLDSLTVTAQALSRLWDIRSSRAS